MPQSGDRHRSPGGKDVRGFFNGDSDADVSTLADKLGVSPSEELDRRESLAQLNVELGKLSPQQQEILRLRLHAGLSYKQIAEVMELTVTNVGYHLHQAIVTLRQRLHRSIRSRHPRARDGCGLQAVIVPIKEIKMPNGLQIRLTNKESFMNVFSKFAWEEWQLTAYLLQELDSEDAAKIKAVVRQIPSWRAS